MLPRHHQMPAEEQRSGGMRSGAHEGLMCPLKRGLGGLRQVIRCRAEVGGQGRHRGDGKPVGPDRPLEKGVGGIDIGASEEEKEFSSSLGFHYICNKN